MAIDDENARLRNAAPLLGVVNIPFTNDSVLRVAQNRERQLQLPAKRFRALRRVDGNSDDLSAKRLNPVVIVTVVRQLAETERSPVAAIEDQHQRAPRVDTGKPLHRPRGIGQFEIRDALPNLWSFIDHDTRSMCR